MSQIFQSLKVDKYGPIAVIRFIRSEIRNPLSVETIGEIHQALDILFAEQGLDNIVFIGTGKTFASGANLREIAQITEKNARDFAAYGQDLMQKIEDAPRPTIAAINGFCFGGALDLALSCKIRIASPQAVFCHPGVNLGIMTGWGGTQRLPRLVGEAAALEMFMTGSRYSAKRALEIGLIDKISDRLGSQTHFESTDWSEIISVK